MQNAPSPSIIMLAPIPWVSAISRKRPRREEANPRQVAKPLDKRMKFPASGFLNRFPTSLALHELTLSLNFSLESICLVEIGPKVPDMTLDDASIATFSIRPTPGAP